MKSLSKLWNRKSVKYKGVLQRCRDTCPPQGRECKQHTWSYDIEVPGLNGKPRHITKAGFKTSKAAYEARLEVQRQHSTGKLPTDSKMTLATWLPLWYETRTDASSESPLRPSTAVMYKTHIDKYLVPYLGRYRLHELTTILVNHKLIEIRKTREAERERCKSHHVPSPRPFGPTTARRVKATLSSALADAMAQGLVANNVALQARQKGRRTPKRPKPRVWEPEQLADFLDWLSERSERMYPLVHLCAFIGLRRGEACGLRWSAVDLKRKTITVDWQHTTAGYKVVKGKPKTDESLDTIDVDDATIEVLKQWRVVQLQDQEDHGDLWEDNGLVFTREDGGELHPDYVTKKFERLVKNFGLDPINLHSLRHTAASLQILAGVDIAVVSKRLRHSAIGLTADTYGHLVGSIGRQAAEAAASVVRPRKPLASEAA